MSDEIKIKVNTAEVDILLNQLKSRASNMRPAMRSVKKIMINAVEENFDQEGRPKWKALSPATLESREAAGHTGKILQRSGRLAASVTGRSGKNFARVGSNVEYAGVQQFGGKSGPFIIRPKRKKALFWPGAAHPVMKVNHPGFEIPARPFLKLAKIDVEDIKSILLRYVTKGK